MPQKLGNPKANRPIKSNLKSKKIYYEEERPIRWSYMKILREFSTLKEFYPEITPYHEAYKMRDNTWAIYTDSFDGMGDPWMYLIEGPKKALLIDNGFGVGNLKGLCEYLTHGKEILCANTHHHFDHAYGNSQFDKVYCHEDEVFSIESIRNPHIWDYLYDENGGIYTSFDPKDIIEFKEYEIVPLKDNECIDLGDGYLVECIPLRGHTPGQSGYLDRQTGCLFTGDTGGAGRAKENDPHPENCTIERLRDDYAKIVERMDEVSGVFPGHGMLDQTPIVLKYSLDACNAILKNPDNYDSISTFETPSGMKVTSYAKYIQQGTSMKYNQQSVYMKK
ncbi:MAG: MBL fold metallo-hydrolase [Traorella sp.]